MIVTVFGSFWFYSPLAGKSAYVLTCKNVWFFFFFLKTVPKCWQLRHIPWGTVASGIFRAAEVKYVPQLMQKFRSKLNKLMK